MFFEGTLQEGIATAVQEAKLVVCFVTDDGAESKLWEKGFLTDSSIESPLRAEAVLLRLQAGSEEAKYLAAIFPLPKTPTLVLIRNGELKEYIAAGTAKEEFLARVRKAMGLIVQSAPAPAEPQLQRQHPPAGHRSAGAGLAALDVSSGTTSSAVDTPASSSHEDQSEPQQPHRQATSRDKGKGRAEPDPSSDDSASHAGKPQAETAKASEEYRRRRQEAQEERRRILEQIEHDREARRQRDEERRAERRAAAAAAAGSMELTPDVGNHGKIAETAAASVGGSVRGASASAASRRSETCALQVRDFDGSTMRTRLPSGSTLRREVREWVDSSRGSSGGGPYVFKVILTPQPNRTIDATEEDQTLADLGLAPSSTLVLIPVPRYATAYAAGGGGLLGNFLAWILGFFHPVVLFFKAFARTPAQIQAEEEIRLSDLEPARQEQHRQQPAGPAGRQERGGARVTGFRNPNDDRRDQQLYNGNSLNFEPRPDDD